MTRYGIAEWYGHDVTTLTVDQRHSYAQAALGASSPPMCPFRSIPCNKKGGVCTLRQYQEDGAHAGEPVGDPVIVCPARFEQDEMLVRWLADIIGIPRQDVLVAREVPFMVGTTTGKPAGRIDLVLAKTDGGLAWFGLEVQAVYFSGPGMDAEFRALLNSTDVRIPYPGAVRRPDWRSSSAKRLMPQLQVKSPTLRRWGTKLAVAVDRPFFEAIGGASADPSQDLNDGDVIWLVPEMADSRLVRGHWEVLTLEASADKLLSARTIRKQDFEDALVGKLRPLSDPSPN